MKPVVIGTVILSMIAVNINTEDLDILDNILVYPIPKTLNVKKRDAPQCLSEGINEFIEEKLAEHTQALEYIVKVIDHHEDMTKKLIDHLSKALEPPRLPVKIDPERAKHNSRRDNMVAENPFLTAGKNIPVYGKLATDLFLKDIHGVPDPIPLVEIDPTKSHRRSFDTNQKLDHQNTIESSPWCEIAMLCKKSVHSVCGFDDNFGYAQFDDICHMLHVNCYYKYNFVLAYTCRPTI